MLVARGLGLPAGILVTDGLGLSAVAEVVPDVAPATSPPPRRRPSRYQKRITVQLAADVLIIEVPGTIVDEPAPLKAEPIRLEVNSRSAATIHAVRERGLTRRVVELDAEITSTDRQQFEMLAPIDVRMHHRDDNRQVVAHLLLAAGEPAAAACLLGAFHAERNLRSHNRI